ncbi:Rv2993c-like domain-containing protein [Peribacillus frigoritolerans]
MVRFQQHKGKVYYGIVEDGEILQLSSDFIEVVKQ